ncbi:GAF domain-containing protein [Streptomyces sp. NPDC051572]|uniref:GAF domain-containing protein n=1 Tax=Streptomyces sp. NPDC051572 TaxID=3155802 RepID=UPI00344E1748
MDPNDDNHDLESFRRGGPQRTARLTALGLNSADAEVAFDRVAALAAQFAGTPLAMVNFINADLQMFRGRYVPKVSPDDGVNVQGGAIPFDLSQLGREAPGEYGFCPHVVGQRKQLALDDVFEYPRYRGNPLVNDLNVRSYLGTPLLDNTGQVLGTVCVADFKAREWTTPIKDTMKELTATLLSDFQLRDSLLAQQQELFGVFDVVPFPIMLTDGPDHLLRYANAKQGQAFGMYPQFSPARKVLTGLDTVGVFRAMDEALLRGESTTLPRVRIRPFDSQGPEDFTFLCMPVRTSPNVPFKGVLTVATNLTHATMPYGVGDPQTFAANVQEKFEQLGPGAFPDRFPGQ